MSEPRDDDLLAGEYVLGVLAANERTAAERRITQDPAFALAVAGWQQRLTPLAALVPPAAPPPDLWDRIAGSIAAPAIAEGTAGATSARPTRLGVRFWRAGAFGALALAAGLTGLLLLRQPAPTMVAVLVPRAGGPALLAVAADPGQLLVRPAGALAALPPGREMELWALPPGARRPQPLGLLPAGGRRLAVGLAVRLTVRLALGTKILVSLEPAGGSPTGQPTGPVLYAGRLEHL